MDTETPLLGLRGCVIDAPEYGKLRTWRDGAVVIGDGHILEVGGYQFLGKKHRPRPIHWQQSDRAVIFPGLIDLHTHLPQYPVVARGRGQLIEWQHQHVYPRERNFAGKVGARESELFFAELARNGTTTAAVFTAIYEDTCDMAFEAAANSGMRVIMGQTMMDVGTYGATQQRKIISVTLLECERTCRKWHGAEDGRLEYAFSPRFALACSERLLRSAGEMAKQFDCYIQTHLAETREECERVKHLFSKAQDYTDVYDKAGLLGPKTILGHCIHLTPRERAVLSDTGTAVAHCPTANLYLSSGIMPLGETLAEHVKVGLGSEVAAGPELNLWQVMRSAIESQKARGFYEKDVVVPTPAEALHLATQGAANAIGKGSIIGSLEPGKEADITVMDLGALLPYGGAETKIADLTPDDMLALCIYRGSPHAVLETFVRGQSLLHAGHHAEHAEHV